MHKTILLIFIAIIIGIQLVWAGTRMFQSMVEGYMAEVSADFVDFVVAGERYPLIHAISKLRFRVLYDDLGIRRPEETKDCSKRRNDGVAVSEARKDFCGRYDEIIEIAKKGLRDLVAFDEMVLLMETRLVTEITKKKARDAVKVWIHRKFRCLDAKTNCGRDERGMLERISGFDPNVLRLYRKTLTNLEKKLFPEQQKDSIIISDLRDSPCTVSEHTEGIMIEHGMVFISKSTFTMGSNAGRPNEKPLHQVELNAYWLDRCEVNNVMYYQFVSRNPFLRKSTFPRQFHDGNYLLLWRDDLLPPENRDSYPVVYVSWNAAQYYCNSLGKRLPSEAEWENAVRAETLTEYSFGSKSENLGTFGWFNENSEGFAHPAAAREFNSYKLYDLYGNVWEWVYDWYAPYSSEKQINPQGPSDGEYRVIRGGSWNTPGFFLRSAMRGDESPINTSAEIGFRCASDTKPLE